MATLREDPYGPFNFKVTISPASGGEFRGGDGVDGIREVEPREGHLGLGKPAGLAGHSVLVDLGLGPVLEAYGAEVVVTHSRYPRFVGALIVCEGGDRADVQLKVTQAVSALTGLSSERISVVKGTP